MPDIFSRWSHADFGPRFASASEIQQYLRAFIQHFDLEKHITFSAAVNKAEWNSPQSTWFVDVESIGRYECDVLINAGGILNNPNYPYLKNIDSFRGEILHTAAWNSDIDLRNKKIAVVGAGASAIQLVPALQPEVSHVDVYIRTPSWITGALGVEEENTTNRDYTEPEIQRYVNDAKYSLDQRKAMEAEFNGMYRAFFKSSPEQKDLRRRLDSRMRELIPDKDLQQSLIPEFEVGCRRLNPGEPYLAALQKHNVQPVFDNIEEITPNGIRAGGQERNVDAIILATGFDTSFRPRFPIIGTEGHDLKDLWKYDPVSYLGLAVSGFPNYLMFLGPNTPVSNGSLMGSLEATSAHFVRLLIKMQTENVASFDVWPEVQADFDQHTQNFMKNMVWTGTCRSWFKRNDNGKVTAIWPGSSLHYREVLANGRFEDFQWKYRQNRFAYWEDGLSAQERVSDTKVQDLSYYMLPAVNLPEELFKWRASPLDNTSTGTSAEGSVTESESFGETEVIVLGVEKGSTGSLPVKEVSRTEMTHVGVVLNIPRRKMSRSWFSRWLKHGVERR